MMIAGATKAAKRATPASPEKRAMLAKIHIARKDLALDEDSYRDLLERMTGKRSAANLRQAQLHDLLDEFKRLGWKAKKGQPKRAGKRKLAEGGQAAKIRALWMNLWHLAEIRDPSEDALAAFVKRTTGVEALQWIDAGQADKAIKALRGWLERKGFEFPNAERREAIMAWREAVGLPPAPEGFADKVAILECQWRRIKDSGTMKFSFFAALGQWCAKNHGAAAPYFLSPERADKAIEELGRWVRQVQGGKS
jgi:phage gp16-like protein